MSHDETFVGIIAIVLGLVALAIAVGPWTGPYRLRSVSAVTERFGKPAARGLWVLVALVSFGAGIAITNGIRPSYVSPTQQPSAE